jgi:hypothetical protein
VFPLGLDRNRKCTTEYTTVFLSEVLSLIQLLLAWNTNRKLEYSEGEING